MVTAMQIAIIVGSTRPNRVSPLVAKWLQGLFNTDQTLSHAKFSIVDMTSFSLPAFNEPTHPITVKDLDKFTDPAIRAWNHEIAKYDAHIVVSPEYLSGIPGALKNAIDCLYHAWTGKPVMIVTYGIFGGVQASQQLRQVLGSGCHMKVASISPTLEFPGRDEQKHNTSPALYSAMGGAISDETFEAWNKQKQDIVAGCHELLRLKED